eukprot:SAG31_NODE_176_length_21334_cov_12.211067_14_plen_126_part_00
MRAAGGSLSHFRPNEANAIEYVPGKGHHLAPHCDDRRLSGDVIATLSLACDAYMTYELDGSVRSLSQKRKVQPSIIRTLLPRRSLQVQTGSVRYDYRHGINKGDFSGPRRVSLTFRQNKLEKYCV